jgi:K+-transporting ATPase KdpF subunit
MDVENFFGLLAAIALVVYLAIALIFPDRF